MSGILGGEALAVVAGQGEGPRVAPPPYSPQALNGGLVRIPAKTHRVDLTEGYEGLHATIRTNPVRRVLDDFNSGDFERMCAGLAEIVLAWNVADDDGQALPITTATVRDLPDDLLRQLVEGFIAEFNARTTLPKGSAAPSATTPTTSAGDPTSDGA